MKNSIRAGFVVVIVCLGMATVGCDSETHPDQRLIDSANSQRQGMAPGQATPPPTGPGAK